MVGDWQFEAVQNLNIIGCNYTEVRATQPKFYAQNILIQGGFLRNFYRFSWNFPRNFWYRTMNPEWLKNLDLSRCRQPDLFFQIFEIESL